VLICDDGVYYITARIASGGGVGQLLRLRIAD